jgi:hypothetical protein
MVVLVITLDAAKAARDKVVGLLSGAPDVTGVGVVRTGDGYGVRVNLRNTQRTLPREVDGVPVSTRVTGSVVAHVR